MEDQGPASAPSTGPTKSGGPVSLGSLHSSAALLSWVTSRSPGVGFTTWHRKLYALEKQSPLGAYLSPAELGRLARLCSIVRFAEGRSIRNDSPFYLVLEGCITCVAFDDEQEAVVSNRLSSRRRSHTRASSGASTRTELTLRRQGVFFTGAEWHGEGMLVGKTAGSVLLAPDPEKLEAFHSSLSREGREGYDAILSTSISKVLSSVNFIAEAQLDANALRNCGELCTYIPLRSGALVFEQGDPADAFFIVLKGKTEVVIDEEQLTGDMEPEDSPRKVTSRPRSEAENKQAGGLTKGYGETFGVASLVLDAPVRQYGMRTTERCLFIRIAFDDFRPFLANNPALEVSLLASTKLFLLQRYSTMPSSIFSAFNAEELKVAASVATFKPLAKGQILYAVGDTPSEFWVVAHGEVVLDYCDGSAPQTLKVGSYFGEVGILLPDTKCFATVTSTMETRLLSISKFDFDGVVDPELHQKREKANVKKGQRRQRKPSVARLAKEHSSRQASPTMLRYQNPSERSLKHALLVELLLKLRRGKVQLQVLLQHPRAHTDFVEFALTELRGALRIDVYNQAFSLLQRVRTAIATLPTVSADTDKDIRQFLNAEARVLLAEQLRRKPCPRMSNSPIFGTVADREADVVGHLTQRSGTLTELEAVLTELCASYTELLELGRAKYVTSQRFDELLDRLGVYAECVAGMVGAEALSQLESQFDTGQGGSKEMGFVPLEVAIEPETRHLQKPKPVSNSPSPKSRARRSSIPGSTRGLRGSSS